VSYDPKTSLIFWPKEQMSRFGQNPFGENLYRVIYGPSRCYLVYGQWNDAGSQRSKWTPLYPQVGNQWILERWKDAWTFARCGPAGWAESPLSVLGPYPSRGEYDLSHVFVLPPASSNVEAAVKAIEAGRNYSEYENFLAVRENVEKEQADKDRQIEDICKNALPAFGCAPMSGPGGGRSTKAAPVRLTAQEAGLPVPRGTKGEGKQRHHFGVPANIKPQRVETNVLV
jgi:hypothetical protein